MKLKTTVIALTTIAMLTTLLGTTAGATRVKPSNDDFAAAVAIGDIDFAERRDLAGATLESGEVLPSCGTLKGSVWYRFVAPATKVYAAWFQGRFDAGIAAYRAGDSGLEEVSCSAGGVLGGVELDAQAEDVFYIQLGNTARKQGTLEFGLSLARWQEETLYETSYTRHQKEQRIELLYVRGEPNALDPRFYDMEIGVSTQIPIRQSIPTFGLVQEKIDIELIRLPASTTTVAMRVVARYDATQTKCAVEDGAHGGCTAYAPVSDPDGFASRDGMESHLAIEIVATHNNDVLVERTVLIPFAGQIGGTTSPKGVDRPA